MSNSVIPVPCSRGFESDAVSRIARHDNGCGPEAGLPQEARKPRNRRTLHGSPAGTPNTTMSYIWILTARGTSTR